MCQRPSILSTGATDPAVLGRSLILAGERSVGRDSKSFPQLLQLRFLLTLSGKKRDLFGGNTFATIATLETLPGA